MGLKQKLPIFCALGASVAAQANAAPAPPPSPDILVAVQAFIQASVGKNLPLYTGLLSDQFVGTDAEVDKIMTRTEWLASTAKAFQNNGQKIQVLSVFYGSHIVGAGLQYRVMVVKRLSNYPEPPHSDCCTLYQTETLAFDKGKVSKIGRSILFDTRLSETGKRTDMPN